MLNKIILNPKLAC